MGLLRLLENQDRRVAVGFQYRRARLRRNHIENTRGEGGGFGFENRIIPLQLELAG